MIIIPNYKSGNYNDFLEHAPNGKHIILITNAQKPAHPYFNPILCMLFKWD